MPWTWKVSTPWVSMRFRLWMSWPWAKPLLSHALEALEGVRVAPQLVGQQLQGHAAAETGVLRLVHHTHPASPEPASVMSTES
jgi:protein subunit release factor B